MKQLALVIAILFSTSFVYGQSTSEDNRTPFSSFLKDRQAGFTYKMADQQSKPDYQSSLDPSIFNLAYKTGYIIFIDEPKYKYENKAYDNLVIALKEADYSIYHITNREYLSFAIPNAFMNNSEDIFFLFDGEYADVHMKYLMDWWDNKTDLNNQTHINNDLLQKLNDQGALSKTLLKTVDNLENQILFLKKEIEGIETKIDIVEADIRSVSAFEKDRTNDVRIPSLFKLFQEKKITYNRGDDFFLNALERLKERGILVDVGGRDWVLRDNVTAPYLHPDLAKAIEAINKNEAEALKKMGFPNGLQIVEAARTPYGQAVQIANAPVAASMFGSGHLCGASVDFNGKGTITKNYNAFAKLMDKYGLYCDPALKPGAVNGQGKSTADPNHVYLGSFKGPKASKKFANDLMSECLGEYQKSMGSEREVQRAKSDGLKSENKILKGITANMDKHLKDINDKIEKLKNEKDGLERDKTEKEKSLENKTKERAVRELEKRLKNDGKNVSQKEIRERLGRSDTPRDGYWERYGEFHSSGKGWECNGLKYENSRGESWGAVECHSTPSEKLGIERLR